MTSTTLNPTLLRPEKPLATVDLLSILFHFTQRRVFAFCTFTASTPTAREPAVPSHLGRAAVLVLDSDFALDSKTARPRSRLVGDIRLIRTSHYVG